MLKSSLLAIAVFVCGDYEVFSTFTWRGEQACRGECGSEKTYWIRFGYKGLEYRHSAKTENKRDAERLLVHYLNQCARGEFQGFEVQETSTYTLNEMLDDFIEDYQRRGMRDVVITQYRSKHLRQFFTDKAVIDIDERQIDLYIKHRLKIGRSRIYCQS